MTSVFAWLDTDESQQRVVDGLLDAFRDRSSMDELGLGVVRDTIANHLFPTTSTTHTRVRYLLIVSWLVREISARRMPPEKAVARLRHDEVRVIDSLLAGGESTGVFGAQAKSRLKVMPSSIYWPSLGYLGLRTVGRQHLRPLPSREHPTGHRDPPG